MIIQTHKFKEVIRIQVCDFGKGRNFDISATPAANTWQNT